MTSTQNYSSIDLAKFVAAIFVVAIHAQPFSGLTQTVVIDVFARMAVPFFFITSSFFFFSKNPGKKELSHYLRRMGILYLFWFVVEFPITCLHAFIEPETPFGHNLLMLLRNFLFGSTFGGSWFLMALMQCILLTWLLARRMRFAVLLVLGAFFYLLAVGSSYYYAFLPSVVQHGVDGYRRWIGSMELSWMSALLPCVLGFWVARYRQTVLEVFTSERLRVLLPVAFLLVCCEVFGVQAAYASVQLQLDKTDVYFLLQPMVLLLFVWLLQKKCTWPLPYRRLRVYSTLFYFSHFVFVFVLVLVNKHVVPVHPLLKYVLVLCCCLLFSRLLLFLSEKKGWGWLKYAY